MHLLINLKPRSIHFNFKKFSYLSVLKSISLTASSLEFINPLCANITLEIFVILGTVISEARADN